MKLKELIVDCIKRNPGFTSEQVCDAVGSSGPYTRKILAMYRQGQPLQSKAKTKRQQTIEWLTDNLDAGTLEASLALGFSTDTIIHAKRAMGIIKKPSERVEFSDDQIADIQQRYESGQTIKRIADAYGTSRTIMRRFVTKDRVKVSQDKIAAAKARRKDADDKKASEKRDKQTGFTHADKASADFSGILERKKTPQTNIRNRAPIYTCLANIL